MKALIKKRWKLLLALAGLAALAVSGIITIDEARQYALAIFGLGAQ